MYRFLLLAAALALLLPVLCGCDGSSRHDVETGGYGTLRGLEITPEPQTLGLRTDKVFYLDWNRGYEPPNQFTVSLKTISEDGTTSPVYTRLIDLDPARPGHYRLEPSWYLPTGTFLLLTVTSYGERVRAMYLTESSSYAVKTQRHSDGEAEHTVVIKQP